MQAWELIKALEEGEKIVNPGFAGEDYTPDIESIDRSDLVEIIKNPQDWQIYTKPRWEDNIPECGLMCLVWDSDMDTKEIAIVSGYDENAYLAYRTSTGIDYKHAEPMTKSEIQQFLDNAPEE